MTTKNTTSKSTVNDIINLRAMLIESETIGKTRKYGKDSATVKGKYFKDNISLFVMFTLKSTMQSRN